MPKGTLGRAACSTDGCERLAHGRGLCKFHYQRSVRGTPRPRWTWTIEERFWSHVVRGTPNECWEWQASFGSTGYGAFPNRTKGVPAKAHRAAWYFTHGPIPDGLWVLHHCDNPPCVNPAHLYLGTVAENARDRVERGRGRAPGSPGELNPHSKLTWADVGEIRRLAATRMKRIDIAARFGVDRTTVHGIVTYRSWKLP